MSDLASPKALGAVIGARCKSATIKWKLEFEDEATAFYTFGLRSGRDDLDILIDCSSDAAILERLDFENIRGVGEYSAIWWESTGDIEAFLSPVRAAGALHKHFADGGRLVVSKDGSGTQTSGRPVIEIGAPSEALSLLGGTSLDERPLSIRISGTHVSTTDQAVERLRSIAGALLFQMDVQYGVTFSLQRRRNHVYLGSGIRRRHPKIELVYPQFELDHQPLELYWYARSARRMPLLQFLAFYQSVEYYFPIYSRSEAADDVRRILRSPGFRPDRQADVARLIDACSSGASSLKDERSQLRSTLVRCISKERMIAFITETGNRRAHFTRPSKLTKKKLPVSGDGDVRDAAAERIYEIRCRIVHTKESQGEERFILPFSEEANLLYPEVELIQFVAREVLANGSTLMGAHLDGVAGSLSAQHDDED